MKVAFISFCVSQFFCSVSMSLNQLITFLFVGWKRFISLEIFMTMLILFFFFFLLIVYSTYIRTKWKCNNVFFYFRGHKGSVHSLLVFGNFLFSSSTDHSIKIWDMSDLNTGCVKTLLKHKQPVSILYQMW